MEALCDVCRSFDLRALLLSSAAIPVRDDVTIWERLFLSTIEESPRLFFKQHPNLLSIKQCSEACSLCSCIWKLYCEGKDAVWLTNEAVNAGISQQQVYITCTPANNLWQKYAQVVVFQKNSSDSTRILASFDPYAERGQPHPVVARTQLTADSPCTY